MGETSFDTAVRLAVMDSFVGGTTPSVGAVARTLGAEIAAVEGAFDRLAAGRAIVLTPGTRKSVGTPARRRPQTPASKRSARTARRRSASRSTLGA